MPKKPAAETPLYVRLPTEASEKLDRAASALGMRKKDLVAQMVKVLDTNQTGPMLGAYSFQPYAQDFPDVMNAQQAGQFLQIDETLVIELAEEGKLPGKKLGTVWRFSREALVAWLAKPEKR